VKICGAMIPLMVIKCDLKLDNITIPAYLCKCDAIYLSTEHTSLLCFFEIFTKSTSPTCYVAQQPGDITSTPLL
jgi:hypothetical protein